MKLTDITPTSVAATKKLKTQVQKSTVAAAKAPRLDLGVVGISIGQEQSTGDTSRSSLPWQNRAFTEDVNADIYQLLSDTGETVGIKLRVTGQNMADVNLNDAAEEAVRLYKMWKIDRVTGDSVINELRVIRNNLSGTDSIFKQLHESERTLHNFGYKPPQWIQQQLDAASLLAKSGRFTSSFLAAVDRIIDFISTLDEYKEHEDSQNFKLIRATLRHIGLAGKRNT